MTGCLRPARGVIGAVTWDPGERNAGAGDERVETAASVGRAPEQARPPVLRYQLCNAEVQIRLNLKNSTDMAEPLATPGKKPPRVTRAVSMSLSCMWKTLNGPSEKPTDEPLLLPPRDRPKRTGNHSTSRYSAPPETRGVVVRPNPSLKAWS